MKFIKKTGLILLVFFTLVIIVITVFVASFDVNQYKPLIIEQVRVQTGRDLSIKEDIHLSVFPWLGLEMSNVALSNAPGFGEQPFARMNKLDVKIELLPLLKKEISIDKVLLHGLYLSLQKNAQGQNNWDDLAKPKESEIKTESEQKTDNSSVPALAALVVKGLEIKDATLVWQDDVSQTKAQLDQFNLSSGAIVLDKTIPVALSAHAQFNQPKADIKLALKTQIKLNLDHMHLVLTDMALQLQTQTPDLAVQQAVIKLTASLNAKLNEEQFKLQNILLSIDAKGDELPGGKLSVTLKTAAEINVKKQTANINALQINTLGMVIKTSAVVSQIIDAPQVKGQFVIDEFNPSLLLRQLGIELPVMRDPGALQKAQMQFNYHVSLKTLQLNVLKIKLDDSEINGWLHVNDFNQPALAYRLNLNNINLDRYLPSAVEAEETAQSTMASENKDIAITLPVELLRNMNMQGVFNAGEILIADQKINKLAIKTQAKGGVVHITSLKAKVLNGDIVLTSQLDVRPDKPKYALNFNAKKLQAAPVVNPVLEGLLGGDAVTVEGAINLTSHIKTQGHSVNTLKAAINGNANFNIGKAQLKGLDVNYFGKKVVVDYLKQKNKTAPKEWPGEYKPKETTVFKTIRASAIIRNGVVVNKDLLLDSKRLKVTGAGQIDLPKSTIDYRAIVDVQPTRLKTATEKLLDIPIPVTVKGSFNQLQIKPDMKAWSKQAGKALKKEVKAEVKKKIKKKTEKKIEKVKKKYGDKLKNKFKGLFR